MSQWLISRIIGRRKIRIINVITPIRNIKDRLFVLPMDGMHGKEALVVLSNLSQLMAGKL